MTALNGPARFVLVAIGERSAQQGPFGVDALPLESATGLQATTVNDAVHYLQARGLVVTTTGIGTSPGYDFLHVKLTAEGRAAYEELKTALTSASVERQDPSVDRAPAREHLDMNENVKESIQSAGWEVWEPVTPKATGGGQCFFCCRTSAADSLAHALVIARGSTSAPGIQEYRPALMGWFRSMWNERVRLDDLIGVVKVAHAPDGRFDREVRVLKRLQHPNLIRLYAHDESSPPKWYVMQLHEGGDLQRKRDEYHRNSQPRVGSPATFEGSVSEVMRRLRGVAEAVAVLHRGDGEQKIIHRDIKPGNILVSLDGRWILSDLGIALDTEGERLTGSELQLSRDWRPDWVVGSEDFTARMDIQMLANVAYYLVAGRKPPPFSQFGRPDYDLRRLQPGVPGTEELHRFVTDHIAGTEVGVKSRTAVEMIAAIDEVLARLSPERGPSVLFSFLSANSQSDAPRREISSAVWGIVQVPPQVRRLTARARVVGGPAKLSFTLSRLGAQPSTLKSTELVIGGAADRGAWNIDPMVLELPNSFRPGAYSLTLQSHDDAIRKEFAISGFMVYAD